MREQLEYDIVIVGAGPSGLATAIRLRQLANKNNQPLSICILEKGSEVGAHILSGAVFEARALNELLPDWQSMDPPFETQVTKDEFLFLTEHTHYSLPTPTALNNRGNYIISLGQFCRWLAGIAEGMDIDIFPGFTAADIIIKNNVVCGIRTGDMGIDKTGVATTQHQPGIDLYAQQTVLAEGCRGSLSKKISAHFNLRANAKPKSYGIGVKELWRVESPLYRQGKVTHSIGWPLARDCYGGSFIYHREDNKVALGLVIGLDYSNPSLDPFRELQRFKTHPSIRPLFENGECLAYGARALNENSWDAIGDVVFPGGLIVGCAAGYMNVAKLKGSHTAMKSGMVAAESIFKAQNHLAAATLDHHNQAIRDSWIYPELVAVRNIRPAFQYGFWTGLAYAAATTYLFRGKEPWTFSSKPDHLQLKPYDANKVINYPKPDGKLTFDKLTALSLSNVYHEENQPCHLQLTDATTPNKINFSTYHGPESCYCPASVYEYLPNASQGVKLQINAQNCIHCKTCDIKDPTQNIQWQPPEGGGGPNYPEM